MYSEAGSGELCISLKPVARIMKKADFGGDEVVLKAIGEREQDRISRFDGHDDSPLSS